MEDIIKDRVKGKNRVYLPQLKGESNPYGTYQLRSAGRTSLEQEDWEQALMMG